MCACVCLLVETLKWENFTRKGFYGYQILPSNIKRESPAGSQVEWIPNANDGKAQLPCPGHEWWQRDDMGRVWPGSPDPSASWDTPSYLVPAPSCSALFVENLLNKFTHCVFSNPTCPCVLLTQCTHCVFSWPTRCTPMCSPTRCLEPWVGQPPLHFWSPLAEE